MPQRRIFLCRDWTLNIVARCVRTRTRVPNIRSICGIHISRPLFVAWSESQFCPWPDRPGQNFGLDSAELRGLQRPLLEKLISG